jgi:hypothetical protein
MIDPHFAQVETWLAAEPHLTAVDVLARLSDRVPSAFGSKQLRTVQRLVRAWRTRAAQLVIHGVDTTIMIEPPAAIPVGGWQREPPRLRPPCLGNIAK